MSNNMTATGAAPRSFNVLLFTVLLAGPVLSVVALANAIERGQLTTLSPLHYIGAAVLFWSPLPFSIPAVLLEAHRDSALANLRGPAGWLLRAVILMPYLMVSPKSQVRAEATASVVGFLAALLVALPYLHS